MNALAHETCFGEEGKAIEPESVTSGKCGARLDSEVGNAPEHNHVVIE